MKRFATLCSLLLISQMAMATDVVSVVDSNNQPIPNATILLGFEAGNPFPNNTLTTGATGTASVPGDWKAALPVTVQAPGYITTTIPVAMPGMMTITLAQQEGSNQIEIKGLNNGFGPMVDNGRLQFGLTIPALTKQQMLAFDLSAVMSPQMDTIDALGKKIDIPSNLTLPDQTVTYIFPIHFNKPTYRSYVRSSGDYLMTATHGNVVLQKLVNDVQNGKSIFEMVNNLNFVEGGTRQVSVSGNVTGQDIAVNQMQFTNQVNVKAPAFPSNQVMVSLALSEQSGGLMVPTDLKRFTPGQAMNMKSAGSAPSVLSLLLVNAKPFVDVMKSALAAISPVSFSGPLAEEPKETAAQSFQQLSFSLNPAASGAAPQFMPLINSPTLDANNVLKMNVPPSMPTGVQPIATYMVLTEIQTFGTGSIKSEQRTRLWEVWSSAWLDQAELPKISFPHNPDRKYRWEVMYLGSNVPSGGTRVNGVDLHAVTHVTRNTLEL